MIVAIGKVSISGTAAACIKRHAGAGNAATAMVRLLHAIARADAQPNGNVVLAGDMFSCFFSIPATDCRVKSLRAYWYSDTLTGRKIVVRIVQG